MTPWDYAKDSEHSHQAALFMWANCAARHGFDYANDKRSYNYKTIDRVSEEMARNGWNACSPQPSLKYLFAIHNQGHGDRIRGNHARAEGVKAGAPDVMLPVPKPSHYPANICCGLFIELKKPSAKPKQFGKGGVREIQTEFHDFLRSQAYRVVVAYGWEEAAEEIQNYLNA